jgi:hypothetical protein
MPRDGRVGCAPFVDGGGDVGAIPDALVEIHASRQFG